MLRATGIDHVVLGCADVEESVRWYTEMLGCEPVRLEEWRRGEAPFVSVRLNDEQIIDLVPQDPVQHQIDHVCLVVEPTDLEALVESGALKVEGGPLRLFGARGLGWGVYVRDPSGHLLELRHYGETARG